MGVKVDIRKCYHEAESGRKRKNRKAFTLDVSFEMENELVVLFGPSGSGKTTLFKCISGITEPDDGKITVDSKIFYDKDKKINLPIQKRNLGYVFQNYTLFPHMNVKKNIECGLKGWEKETREKRVLEVLNLLRIEELETRYPSSFQAGKSRELLWQGLLPPDQSSCCLTSPFLHLTGK